MENLTHNPQATARLTPAQTYALHQKRVRRQAAMDRRTAESRAETLRVLDLYANGSSKRLQAAPAPTFKEASTFTTVKLAGGASASQAACKAAKTRRERAKDTSPEAEARRERRRARRLARKQRQTKG